MLFRVPRKGVIVIRDFPIEFAARLDVHRDKRLYREHGLDRPVVEIRERPVPGNPHPRAYLAILDAYVGVYELAPNFQVAVTREGNSLFAQATAQPKFQLYPESDIEFFLKVVDASFIFVRGATGGVDQIILHQGGASIPGKRVK